MHIIINYFYIFFTITADATISFSTVYFNLLPVTAEDSSLIVVLTNRDAYATSPSRAPFASYSATVLNPFIRFDRGMEEKPTKSCRLIPGSITRNMSCAWSGLVTTNVNTYKLIDMYRKYISANDNIMNYHSN